MYTELLKKARTRRLEALASVCTRADNVIPFDRALRREPRNMVVPFISTRAAPLRLAA